MARKKLWTDKQLALAVKNNTSIYGVKRELGLSPTGGGTHLSIRKRIKILKLDDSHFTGQGWCVGERRSGINQFIRRFVKIPLEKILVKGSTYLSTSRLKKRLIDEGLLKNECCICGQKPIWNGLVLVLQLDHIDGDPTNNTIINLRILCPNCHTQTPTYSGRKLRKEKPKKLKPVKKEKLPKDPNWRNRPKPNQRKTTRPPYDVLISEIQDNGFCATGRKYGVSDNAVRKWLKWMNPNHYDRHS